MKNLISHIKESLRIGLNDNPDINFDDIQYLYEICFRNNDKIFTIEKYEVEHIKTYKDFYYITAIKEYPNRCGYTLEDLKYDEENQVFYKNNTKYLKDLSVCIYILDNTYAGDILVKNARNLSGGIKYSINDILSDLGINNFPHSNLDTKAQIYDFVDTNF